MRRARTLGGGFALVGLTLLLLVRMTASSPQAGASPAAQLPTASSAFEPILGLPATKVVVLGSSPEEASGEAWAYGFLGDVPATVNGASYSHQLTLLEHVNPSGWQVVPLPSGTGGEPLETHEGETGAPPYSLGALGGSVTSAGGVVLLTPGGVVIRGPGQQPRLVPEPAGTDGGIGANAAYSAVDEPPDETDGSHTGLLAASTCSPKTTGEPSTPCVLHYNGKVWRTEQILLPSKGRLGFESEALACGGTHTHPAGSSSENCWLLAGYHAGTTGGTVNRLALFRRVPSAGKASEYAWVQQRFTSWPLGEGTPPMGVTESSSVFPLGPGSQMLTVTSAGVWVDFQVKAGSASGSIEMSQLVGSSSSQGSGVGVIGTWCFGVTESLAAPGCVFGHSIESSLPPRYRSFASAGGSSGDPGDRVITGMVGGAMLELSNAGNFEYTVGAGGNGGGSAGAAFSFLPGGVVEQGFIGEGDTPAPDYQGQSQIVGVTPQPNGDQLQDMSVPFRHPLLAVAQSPGATAGDPQAAAIAVGAEGEIGRFVPGQGWRSESLYSSSGEAQTPTLRGVAWPEAGRAYAVGDGGAMWLWRADTGLWEPDPAVPYNFIGNLTGIAFAPSEPELGFAVGKQGVLLRYGKTWEEISAAERGKLEGELKFSEEQLNFTAIAFAGHDALASYRTLGGGQGVESGGLLVEDGSGWHVDHSAANLLATLPEARDTILSKVAGLADGGAVAAGPGLVIERESESSPWRFTPLPLPEAQSVSALAAYRDASGAVRAIASIDLDPYANPNYGGGPRVGPYAGDFAPVPSPGQPPAHLSPDPLPNTGYLLKETASGWSDMEHMALEAIETKGEDKDAPVRPDPAQGLLVNPDGSSGLAVGGQTGTTYETAAAMRFGAASSMAGSDTPAPIATTFGDATFAVGGSAACEQACADFANEGLAPDALLTHALQSANQIAASSPGGLRDFLYTGDRLLIDSPSLGAEAFKRELARYAALLSSGGPLPVHAVVSPKDVPSDGGIAAFVKALEPFIPGSGHAYYSFLSEGASGGKVKVIALDFSTGTLEAPGTPEPNAQEEWLKRELRAAKEQGVAAIVMGNASLGFTVPEPTAQNPDPLQAGDAAVVSKILIEDGASAYLFDYPGINVESQVSFGTAHIPAFGTGTLGYVSPPYTFRADSLGSSGFLLLDVHTAQRNPLTNISPVSARVEPNIGELALAATDGTLLRRSQIGLFEGLARVPPSGRAISPTASGNPIVLGPEPYEPIPFDCQGPNCADQVPTDYTFSSSKPDVGNFVAHDPSSANPRQVKLGPNKLPVQDPHSGLFCAYNEGTTTVSITAGGLTYSEPITVQGGSVQYPCGTVPLKNPPPAKAVEQQFEIPALSPSLPKTAPLIPAIHLSVPQPPVQGQHVKPVKRPVAPYPFVYTPAQLIPVLAVVPPAPQTAARPTPPSGTSPVPAQSPITQPVGVDEYEEKSQSATEGVHNMAAYSYTEQGPMPAWPLGLILILVAAGVAFRPNGKDNEHVYVRASSD